MTMKLSMSLIVMLEACVVIIELKGLAEFYRDKQLDGFKCPASTALFDYNSSFDRTHCAFNCSRTFTCIGVFYSPTTARCIGCASQFDIDLKETLSDSVFYKRKYDYTYLGCYNDYLPHRILNGPYMSWTNMTTEECVGYCTRSNFTHALTELNTYCFCGNGLIEPFVERPEIECNTYCAGNPNQMCGAAYRGSVYRISSL